MKKIFFLLFTTGYFLLATASTSHAADADTPIASAEAILDQTKKEILQKALDKNLKNTQTILGENSNQIVGYAGTVSDIKQGVFTLNTDATTLQISLGATTAIIKDNQPLKPELISVKDRALVIGSLSSPDILTAKRIVIYQQVAPKYEKKAVFSPIVKVDLKKKTLTLKVNDKNQEVTLGKLIKIDLTTLKLTQKIFGIILISADGTVSLIQGKVL